MKTIWKNLSSRVWLIVTSSVLVLALVVNILASTILNDLIGTVLGRATTQIVGDAVSNYQLDEGITDKASAKARGEKLTLEATREGFTLLKNANNSALPLAASETKVSVFGKNSVNMAIGGSGSGGSIGADSKSIFDSLTAAGFTYNQTLVDFYKDNSKSGNGRSTNPTNLDNGTPVVLDEGETPISAYEQSVWDSCEEYSDVALIVITRIGGEGFDLPRDIANGTHFLQLSQEEKDLINTVSTKNFGKVVVLLNVAATMELKDVQDNAGVDAILWVGYAGGNGLMALGEILKGEYKDASGNTVQLSPSGKTVDTYAADFSKNPTWQNFGGDYYDSATPSGQTSDAYVKRVGRGWTNESVYFVDYEESIYVGYRYYETAAAEGAINYDEEVVYPFGYGLSYSTFSWELTNKSNIPTALTKNTAMTFEVEVTNTGSYPAKDVVQLYVTPPYNDGGLEKSHKVLVGFAKTPVIAPNASETVSITVDTPYEYASYDYLGKSGQKGYVVEAGNYTFTLSTDSHNAKSMTDAVITASVANNIYYDKAMYGTEEQADIAVKNLYTDNTDEWFNSDAQLGTLLSRSDFAGTMPQHRTLAEKTINGTDCAVDDAYVAKIKSTQSNPNRPQMNDPAYQTGANNGIMFKDLVGKNYNDPVWERFLDQLTVAQMKDLTNKGGFHTGAIEEFQIPQTTSADGPVGWCNFMGDPTVYGTCVYCCEVVFASTWNIDILEEFGRAVGDEGLVGNERGDGAPYTGWYAPGLNIHRSPFGGRNFEYYSEDPFVSGQMTAAVMKGAAAKGVYVNLKHFALNDQETHRSINGLITWATEQSMREIYLKAFEIAIKTAKFDYDVKAMGVMSSFNRIGNVFTGSDYRLLTTILREEWGFEGLVICDFNTNEHMIVRDMVYAGGDLNLEVANQQVWANPDENNKSDVAVLRQASKNILYVVANSNAYRGEFVMVMPLWQIIMYIVTAVVVVGLGVWGFFAIRKAFKKSEIDA